MEAGSLELFLEGVERAELLGFRFSFSLSGHFENDSLRTIFRLAGLVTPAWSGLSVNPLTPKECARDRNDWRQFPGTLVSPLYMN
jgi:hypothetical protein